MSDEYTIQEPRLPSAREVRERIHREQMKEARRRAGITPELLKASTAGGTIVALQIGELSAREIFRMVLPGVPKDEQRELLDSFEELLYKRRKQVARAVRYIDAHYDIVEKEEDQ